LGDGVERGHVAFYDCTGAELGWLRSLVRLNEMQRVSARWRGVSELAS
jgi:hypothetical protein